MAKRLVFTVTNDLNFDQRMNRICSSLTEAGFEVILVGRIRKKSQPLLEKKYQQKRLYCFFDKGKLFYAEYNIRLFFFLLFLKMDALCAIDLDTILPILYVSKIKKVKRVFDAHELFCEMEEIVSRPGIYKIWKKIEQHCVPQFPVGYTIGECYAEQFQSMYQVNYEIVRNATVLRPLTSNIPKEKYILYQGAVNEGRSFETLIPAMKFVPCKLIICGEGNFYTQSKTLVKQYELEDKIIFKGYIEPSALIDYTKNAHIGITLFTNQGKSNYYSMANRYFDYMHYGVPQLCTAYPEYVKVNQNYEVAYLVQNTLVDTIAQGLNNLLNNNMLYNKLKENCLRAREIYCWQQEEKKLIHLYQKLFEQ